MAKKKTEVKCEGCRLCKYRVAPPKGPNNTPVPSCCFGYEIHDDRPMNDCCLFTEGDYYIRRPEQP